MIMATNLLLPVILRPNNYHYTRRKYRENPSQPLHASRRVLPVARILPLNLYTAVIDLGLPPSFSVSILRLKLHFSSADGAPNNVVIQAIGFSAPKLSSAVLSSLIKLVCSIDLPTEHVLTVTDFKNPNDPNDISFQAHPENYPVAELEYPNTGAKERSVSSDDVSIAFSTHVTGLFSSRPRTRTIITRLWILKSPCWQSWSVSLP